MREALLVAGAAGVVAIVGIAVDASSSYDSMLRETRDGLVRTAQAAATAIDGDAHATLLEAEQESGEVYQQLVGRLRRFAHQAAPAVAYVYTLRLVDDKVHFVLDAADVGDHDGDGVEDHSFLMEVYDEVDASAVEALRTGSARIVDEPVTDKWGTFLSAYAPIQDSRGDCVGVVGVDLGIASLLESRSRLYWRTALTATVLAGLAAVLGIAVYRSRSRLVERLRQEAAANELATKQRVAVAASDAKTRFLAHMSHEIRTPLGIVAGNAELLLDPATSPVSRQDYAEAIYRSSKHLLVLLNDVLDLAKIESGKLLVESVPTRLPELLFEVRDMFAVTARERGLALDFDAPAELPTVIQSDPLRIRQVLVNLIGNALKFTAVGGVRVIVRVDRAAARLELQVVDTGPGMTRLQAQTLFEPFSQADASVARKHGGTGLGLSISHELCALLGGELRAISEVGRGTTFVAVVATGPLDGVEFVPLRAADDSVPTGCDVPLLAGRRVLFVDDTPDNLRLYGTILRRAGAEVAEAADGRTACAAVMGAEKPWDLIVLDVQMVGMDGHEVARTLRANGVTTPILALTASALTADEEACMRSGCSAFAAKPIARRKLIAECSRLVQA